MLRTFYRTLFCIRIHRFADEFNLKSHHHNYTCTTYHTTDTMAHTPTHTQNHVSVSAPSTTTTIQWCASMCTNILNRFEKKKQITHFNAFPGGTIPNVSVTQKVFCTQTHTNKSRAHTFIIVLQSHSTRLRICEMRCTSQASTAAHTSQRTRWFWASASCISATRAVVRFKLPASQHVIV